MTPTLFTAIIGLLTALPDLVKVAGAIIDYFNRGGSPEVLAKALSDAFVGLQAATTSKEKSDAAKAISDYISQLPPR